MARRPLQTGRACRIYLITPPVLEPRLFAEQLGRALDAGDVAAVQLRLKGASDDVWRRTIDLLRPVAAARDVAFWLNDRADLVVATGCDGVHVGQEDTPARAARTLIGPGLCLGVTCKGSRDLATRARADGANYVAFGAFFPSTTKQVTNRIDPEILRWWASEGDCPSCAIGGITPANCAPLVRAGANMLAVIGCIWNDPSGPAAAVRTLNKAIAGAQA